MESPIEIIEQKSFMLCSDMIISSNSYHTHSSNILAAINPSWHWSNLNWPLNWNGNNGSSGISLNWKPLNWWLEWWGVHDIIHILVPQIDFSSCLESACILMGPIDKTLVYFSVVRLLWIIPYTFGLMWLTMFFQLCKLPFCLSSGCPLTCFQNMVTLLPGM